ncbi:Uncharacterised protein [Staphylococcus gallinarum]|uniref:Uncharacterized protein n=1 Tax=Staphylococcus gallinarum TaxID=1293 RepID=A0A380FKT4_STAGA|nr:Uncharacterised protein [Staphylococcus gallinarum]
MQGKMEQQIKTKDTCKDIVERVKELLNKE